MYEYLLFVMLKTLKDSLQKIIIQSKVTHKTI